MTAETASNDTEHPAPARKVDGTSRTHLIVAAVFLVVGVIVATVAALQLVLPDLLAGSALTTHGRLAPTARFLLLEGWLTIGLLGASYWAIERIAGDDGTRSPLGLASLVVITIGVVAGTAGIVLGYQDGLPGQAAPIWARAILTIGYLLAAVALVRAAGGAKDRLGAGGWYLLSAPVWLTLAAIVGLIPEIDGIGGNIQNSFVNAGFAGLFVIAASVGLLYVGFATITGADPGESRPLSALGFWSLTLVWANMGAVSLIYTPAPNWYETISVAFAIGSLIPLLTIATDIGLMVRGRVDVIGDRGTLRYLVVSGLSLTVLTLANLLLAWRATSAIIQYTTWVSGAWVLLVLGGGSFAIFAINSLSRGGSAGGRSTHFLFSSLGLATASIGLLVGGAVVGFSWGAGSASQAFPDAGPGWQVTADSAVPFLWIAALGWGVFLLGQLIYVITLGSRSSDEVAIPDGDLPFDLEFEGSPRYATWTRLRWGIVVVFGFAATMTWLLPAFDGADREATLLADDSRTYEPGTSEFEGRNLYISEGCIECHTQVVRPVGTDVGLGPVSVAGDYAHENPALLGTARFGPDLTHFASRGEFFDKVIVQAHIEDPQSVVPWSTMPSYSYLSAEQVGQLISYIETLR